MNLVIDIGNTYTKLGIFDNQQLIFNHSTDDFSIENLTTLKKEYKEIKNCILSSTKSYSDEIVVGLRGNCDFFIELNENTPVPIENLYHSRETLGRDRLAGAVGANVLFPHENILIIDAGTALTFDVINSKNQFVGGNISLGLEMRYKGLNHFTNRLPLLQKTNEFPLIGNNTSDAIVAGVQNGILFEVESYIDRLQIHFKNLKVVITGGDSLFFEEQLKKSIFVYPNLILLGLNTILEYNAG